MHTSLLFLQTINTVVLMQCSCSCSFIACILSRKWRDTAPFGLTCFPLLIMTWIMEPAVILR